MNTPRSVDMKQLNKILKNYTKEQGNAIPDIVSVPLLYKGKKYKNESSYFWENINNNGIHKAGLKFTKEGNNYVIHTYTLVTCGYNPSRPDEQQWEVCNTEIFWISGTGKIIQCQGRFNILSINQGYQLLNKYLNQRVFVSLKTVELPPESSPPDITDLFEDSESDEEVEGMLPWMIEMLLSQETLKYVDVDKF
jgi:predicted heme/steroid binding protein